MFKNKSPGGLGQILRLHRNIRNPTEEWCMYETLHAQGQDPDFISGSEQCAKSYPIIS